MVFRKHLFYLLAFQLIMGSCNEVYAQKESLSKLTIEDLIENIASSSNADLDYTSLYEDLNYHLNNPLNLNEAETSDLEKLHILNDFQIKSLLNYIQENGKMLSIYELQVVHGFSDSDIENIIPFVIVSDSPIENNYKLKNSLKYGNHQIFLRGQEVLEQQQGYRPITDSALMESPNSRYLGSTYKLYSKYKFNYKDKIYWGITAEKDPGEEFFEGNNKNGFDYYSAHLQVNNIGLIKTIGLGDFEAKFGQGLITWNEMAVSKSPYVLNIRKKAQGLRKYSSTNENRFLRGVGATLAFKGFELTGFYSKKNIDANVIDSLGTTVSSFQNTGYHSTPAEIADKKSVTEEIIGSNLIYNHSLFKIGITGLHYTYSAALAKDTTPENQFDFRGKENSNMSIDYQFGYGNFRFFGEEAISTNGGKAFLNGLLVNPAAQISFSVLHRYYQKNYQANYGNAFSESSGNSNESGLYFGIEVYPIKFWKLTAYYDNYKFLWLNSGANAPSHGHDWFFQTDYNPTKSLGMYLRIKNENKQVNQNLSSGTSKLVSQENLKIRFHINTQINEQLSLKNRIETSRFEEDSETLGGYLVYQDVFYVFKKPPLSLNMRYAIFDTDTYDSRIYAYESDILYAFSVPAYYWKGSRFYVNLKYSIKEFMDIWLRYAQTYYSNQDVISSGLNQIQGNTRSEVKIQVRIKL